MINRLIIKNFKCIKHADIMFNSTKNIIVGNNGVGKSTIIEALSLALGYGLNKLEITPYLFNSDKIREFEVNKIPPEITIELFLDKTEDKEEEFCGTNNSLHSKQYGLCLKIAMDPAYNDLFEREKETCNIIPCEYYTVERYWFSDQKVVQLLMPFSVKIVDSTTSYFNSSTNHYVTSLINKYVGDEDLIKIRSSLREMKNSFDEGKISEVNEKLHESIVNEIKDRQLDISVDVTSHVIMRNIICPMLDHIPVEQIGAGDLCILKTMLSISKGSKDPKRKIIIIEEPESHLSHTKMYELLSALDEYVLDGQTQLIITTHNSFIANKLDLSNLIMIENNQGELSANCFTKDDAKPYKYFSKVSNYPTLRILLCKAAILVEGPTDEMVVTYYYEKKFHKHPFEDGIELISAEGVGFKHYTELVSGTDKRVSVITDNDGYSYEELVAQRGYEQEDLNGNIHLFTEPDTELKTLEPSMVGVNDVARLAGVVRKQKYEGEETKETLSQFMENNKTEWGYRLLEHVHDEAIFNVPAYIVEAVNWVRP